MSKILSVMMVLLLSVSAASAQNIQLRPFLAGLNRPLFITSARDGTKRLFVVEKTGTIRVVRNRELLPVPYLDIARKVSAGNEQGLLGLAFSPNFLTDKRAFVSYTDGRGRPTIASYQVSADDPDRLDPRSEAILLSLEHPYSNHNGGAIEFGPDGMLYVGTGDGGSGGDPHGNGQNLNSLLGKMLRIDVRTPGEYRVPADNPFVSQEGARGEIWAYGLRNPWRYSFDPATGRLFTADVGQNALEEVNIVERGKNYGWNIMEASRCFKPSNGCSSENLVLPIAEYGREEGVSVTGGYVYRGTAIPELVGRYIFGDFGSGKIWTLTEQTDGSWKRELLMQKSFAISSFGVDDDGELYLTDLRGGVYKFSR